MTKKELENKLTAVTARAELMAAVLDASRERAEKLQETLDALREMAPDNQADLQVWIARSDEGSPLCIAGAGDLNVEVYYDAGVITGVLVGKGSKYVTGAGMVPWALVG